MYLGMVGVVPSNVLVQRSCVSCKSRQYALKSSRFNSRTPLPHVDTEAASWKESDACTMEPAAVDDLSTVVVTSVNPASDQPVEMVAASPILQKDDTFHM